jgi:hypothetical protein
MAMDLGLPDAYEDLTRRLIVKEVPEWPPGSNTNAEERSLMRKTRTWFGLLVLDTISRLYMDKWRDLAFESDARRCRILLQHGLLTTLDLRLLSQVELIVLQARINRSFSGAQDDAIDKATLVEDIKLDLDVWFGDWLRIMENDRSPETPSLIVNLKMQRYWTEVMCFCRAIRSTGVENVSAMADEELQMLYMVKEPLKKHLTVMVSDFEHYLSNFRYAIDYVWAKCAFSLLLQLKIGRLLPDTDEENYRLLSQGRQLMSDLNTVGTIGGSSSSRLYLQILNTTIEKYGRALQEQQNAAASGFPPGPGLWVMPNAQAELELFIPDQFVFEWDFPGLTLFSSPTSWVDVFDELMGNGMGTGMGTGIGTVIDSLPGAQG